MLAIDLPRARRLAFGVVLGQAAVSVMVALGAWGLAGRGAAVSGLIGGGIATAGSLAMAVVAFARASSASRVLGAFYVGEAVKLAVVVVLFVAVLRTLRVVPLAMLAGFAATYLVFWIALVGALPAVGTRRGA